MNSPFRMNQPDGLPARLPQPGAEALAHSRRLEHQIRAGIDAGNGRITFRRFMEMALYEPGLGYYSAGMTKFGVDGDFITAPETSAIFSRCLARQCEEILARLGGGDILELGAGSGIMAADLLQELTRRDSLPGRYLILETSADLRQRQRHTLQRTVPELLPRVVWLDGLPDVAFKGVVLANELLDAMPVERIRLRSAGVYELQVGYRDGQFVLLESLAEGDLADEVERRLQGLRQGLADGYTTEVNMSIGGLIESLSRVLTSGAMLFIDYGYPRPEYYHPQRTQGTLMCHYRHRAHDEPFLHVGLQDITAWVDFTALAEAATAAGLEVRGFTTQAHFLMGNGLDEFAAAVATDDLQSATELSGQIKRLTMPGEMGERFKVMALTRGLSAGLAGFRLTDYRNRL